ncbi:Uncharacterised protein [Mycobacteroides abscessus subsp. abscessus]|nr:Uncharacterised protein [Mycobacteroides abscessus subsp. abscessus]
MTSDRRAVETGVRPGVAGRRVRGQARGQRAPHAAAVGYIAATRNVGPHNPGDTIRPCPRTPGYENAKVNR